MTSNTDNANDSPLFRQEVFDAKNRDRLGSISLVPKPSFFIVSLIASLIALSILAFLYFGSYTRRISVSGQLLPISGLIRIQSPQPGIVLEKHVVEGQKVKKGDVLYVLSSDRVGASSVELQAQISQQIGTRKKSMELEIARNRQSEQTELIQLNQRLKFLSNEKDSITNQIALQEQRVGLAKDSYDRYHGLAEKDFVAKEQLIEKELELSEQKTRLQALQRDLLNVLKERAAVQREMSDTQSRFSNQNAQLQRAISTAKQESTEVEGRSRVIISAPQAGTATLVTAEIGQAIDSAKQLTSLVPEQSSLEARLYAPSSAVGFVRVGNIVLLRYQPYPYQKFGLYEGVVKSISSASVSGEELSSIAVPGQTVNEPVYSISVTLKQQYVTTYGEQRTLQSGTRLEADIMQENRKLYEWVLEPLYSITGRIR